MSDQAKKAMEDTKEVKTDEQMAQDFIKEYDELVAKHQMQIVANPAWKMSQDTGTFNLIIQVSVGKIKQNI